MDDIESRKEIGIAEHVDRVGNDQLVRVIGVRLVVNADDLETRPRIAHRCAASARE
jgi:hypothetical protein